MLIYNPPKAYKNQEFLNSPPARHIRILCEYEETRQRLLREGVEDTIVFFGSARARDPEVAASEVESIHRMIDENPDDPSLKTRLSEAAQAQALSVFYPHARELARRVTEWSMARQGPSYTVTTGGGPGIMEAANRGAADAGGPSMGLGISLPFEQGVNGWVNQELAFEFHYFFTRKYWFMYLCKAMVIFPGGFGTMDELFESLTLLQTGKVAKRIPMILFGTDYWSRVLDFDAMVEFGTIAPHDPALVFRTDSVDDAYDFLTRSLESAEEQERAEREQEEDE